MRGSKIPAALKKQSSGGSCEANLNYSRRFSEDTMDSSRTSPQKGSPGRYNSVCSFESGKASEFDVFVSWVVIFGDLLFPVLLH